jgi:hypothetical protein
VKESAELWRAEEIKFVIEVEAKIAGPQFGKPAVGRIVEKFVSGAER